MKFEADIVGFEILGQKMARLFDNHRNAAIGALNEASLKVQNTARTIIQANLSKGKPYPGGTRFASLAGYPPNSQHGSAGFVGTIQFDVDEGDVSARVGTNDIRGLWFEFGTKYMDARPWLERSFEINKDAIKEIFRKWLEKVTVNG